MQVPNPPVDDFQYWDGVKLVHADRLAIYRQIMIWTRGKPNELANKVFSITPNETDIEKLMESWDAAEKLVAMVREVFKMAPFDPNTGQGAQEEHCWVVWEAYCDSMAADKKKIETSPTTSSPTAAPASSQPIPSTSV